MVSVWVGNNDNSKMNPYLVSGVTGAAPIWNDIMSFVLKDREDVLPPKPESLITTAVCGVNQADCQGRNEYYVKGTETNQLNGRIEKKNTWIDKETNRPPLPDKTDNIELQEKQMASDIFTSEYCLDCSHDKEPNVLISLQQFYERLKTSPFLPKTFLVRPTK